MKTSKNETLVNLNPGTPTHKNKIEDPITKATMQVINHPSIHLNENQGHFSPTGNFVSGHPRQLCYMKLESTDEPTVVFGTVESVTNCTNDMFSCRSQCGKYARTHTFRLEVNKYLSQSWGLSISLRMEK